VTVTVTVDAAVRPPASETFTQEAPGFCIADSCGFDAAMTPDVEVATVQFPLLYDPTPSPSGVVVAGDTDVSVTATLPAVATENVKTSEPFGARVPLKVSVDAVFEGAAGSPPPNRSPNGLLQADVISIDAGIRSDRNSRRTIIVAGIGPSLRAH
jgi:hypothetical protein